MKPPSRGEIRRLVHQQKFQPVGQARHRGDVLGERLDRAQPLRPPARSAPDRRASARAALMPSRRLARSRGPPRATDSRASARDDIGRGAQRLAQPGGAIRNRRRTTATASWRAAIAFTSVSGAASRAASSRAPAAVTVRSIAGEQLPLRCARQGSRSVPDCAASRRRSP